uniref:RING-type domain-containing protein n=1 Tax=Labrus bergylta TaxID=56723 RepID=A0A3Q3E606_9LABR
MTTITVEKKYDPLDTTLKFVNRDDLDPICPALVEGTKWCNKLLSYQEVCKMAAAEFFEMKPVSHPVCRTHVERTDLSNLCVHCTICTADQKKIYYFCWQCQREWKGPGPRSDRCENDGCINKDLQLLQTCKTISLPDVEGVTDCPSVRACPTCGLSVEHSSQYCKNITCPRCHIEFCFVCLRLKLECNKTSSPYKICPSGVAPRQTSIPVWQRK